MAPVRIPVGGGSPEGTNSAHLLPDRGLLVDPGPPGDDSWADLRRGIEAASFDVESVDDVFVTHWHVDHAGLAVRLAEAAGATVHLHADDAPLVGDYARERDRRLDRDARQLEAWGVPADVIAAVRSADTPSPLPESYPVREHGDDGTVAGLDLVPSPGHTLGHAALLGPEAGDLFVGDAMLPTYTPNVGGGDTRMADPLSAYFDTLDRFEAATAGRSTEVHPGHGAGLDFPSRLEAIREHHRERSTAVLSTVRRDGPSTPWTIAKALFGEMEGVHAKMGAGEAAAHLGRLHRRGRLELVMEDPRRYAVDDA